LSVKLPDSYCRALAQVYRLVLFEILPCLERKLFWRPDREALAAIKESLSEMYSCYCRLRLLNQRFVFVPLAHMKSLSPEYYSTPSWELISWDTTTPSDRTVAHKL
jgi:hypothetical protein